jgi:putative ABC transport system ATP-binding protein
MNNQEWTLEATGIKKVYKRGSEDIAALDGISLKIHRGEFVSFTGPSGSGKTTLINILGCLDNATSGSLILGGRTIFTESQNLSEAELTKIRRSVFGYIFQKFYLLPTLTVLENVILPFTFFKKEGAAKDPQEILRSLGMGKRFNHLPGQLSGGEMQRVAIARALVNNPDILLADEPTGNLDSKRSQEIGEVIRMLNQKEGLTVLLVTHNLALAKLAGRTVELQDGKLRDGGSSEPQNS